MAEEILHQEEVLNQEGEERIEIDVEDEDLEQLLFDLNDILFIQEEKIKIKRKRIVNCFLKKLRVSVLKLLKRMRIPPVLPLQQFNKLHLFCVVCMHAGHSSGAWPQTLNPNPTKASGYNPMGLTLIRQYSNNQTFFVSWGAQPMLPCPMAGQSPTQRSWVGLGLALYPMTEDRRP